MDWSFGRPSRGCKECGHRYPLEFFRLNVGKHACQRARCKGCEGKRRHAQASADPWLPWARATLRRHANQDKEKGFAEYQAFADFVGATGITPESLAAEARHQVESGGKCYHCLPWSELGQIYNDRRCRMTLDRKDPYRPLMKGNYEFLCATGNSQKGGMDPTTWAINRRCWELLELHGPVPRLRQAEMFEA